MKKNKFLFLCLSFLLVGCNGLNFGNNGGSQEGDNPYKKDESGESGNGNSGQSSNPIEEEHNEEENIEVDVNTGGDDVKVESDETSSITDLSVDGIAFANNVFTISKAGTYSFTGEFVGQIYIEAGDDDDVKIELNAFTIKYDANSPIFCANANELKVNAKTDTVNYIYDTRAAEEEEDETQGGGAIYSKCDTKITGSGSLYITGSYNNGIHCTKTLKLQQTVNNNSSLQVNSRNIALKGNDGIEVKSGNIVAISTGGEGLKSTDSDISKKGNQRGTIEITGGQLDVYSCQDAIEASYNINIHEGTDDDGATTTPVVNIYTSNYSKYSSEVVTSTESTMYIKTSSTYSSTYKYSLLFQKEDSSTTWVDATYDKTEQGRRSTYYFFKVERPSNAKSFKIYKFYASDSSHDVSNAVQLMNSFVNINSSYDTLQFTASGSYITAGSWTSYSTQSSQGGGFQPGGWGGMGQGGNMNDGNNEKAEYSAKGLKADNIVEISAGKIYIKSYDDGIHANYGTTLENEETGLGDVVISGGEIEIYAADDGIHADRYLTINGGSINVTYAYEGLEGNYITIDGGYTKVYSTDDGLNAANKAGLTPKIDIQDGILDVTVYGGDVDGIDSNGSFAMSGGKVITKGGNGQMSTGLDVDNSVSITGGTFVGFGSLESRPSTGSGMTNYTLSGSYSIGTYKVKFADGV